MGHSKQKEQGGRCVAPKVVIHKLNGQVGTSNPLETLVHAAEELLVKASEITGHVHGVSPPPDLKSYIVLLISTPA